MEYKVGAHYSAMITVKMITQMTNELDGVADTLE